MKSALLQLTLNFASQKWRIHTLLPSKRSESDVGCNAWADLTLPSHWSESPSGQRGCEFGDRDSSHAACYCAISFWLRWWRVPVGCVSIGAKPFPSMCSIRNCLWMQKACSCSEDSDRPVSHLECVALMCFPCICMDGIMLWTKWLGARTKISMLQRASRSAENDPDCCDACVKASAPAEARTFLQVLALATRFWLPWFSLWALVAFAPARGKAFSGSKAMQCTKPLLLQKRSRPHAPCLGSDTPLLVSTTSAGCFGRRSTSLSWRLEPNRAPTSGT